MNTLRWILLILGIVLIAGIYFLGRRKERRIRIRREPALEDQPLSVDVLRHRHAHSASGEALENAEALSAVYAATDPSENVTGEVLEDADWLDFESLIKESVSVIPSQKPSSKTTPPKSPSSSSAPSVKNAASASSILLDGDLVVLHAFAREPDRIEGAELYALMQEHGYVRGRQDVFYKRNSNEACLVANAFKPGTFPEVPEAFETRGVSLVLRLSKTDKPLDSFEEVLSLAHAFQERLDCRLYDSQRSSLTRQTITYLHDEIQQYQFRHSL
jgi:cell division protein ZipA